MTCITKHAVTDGIEYRGKIRIKLELRVEMGVTKILDVLCEVSEKENVLFTNLAGDLDLNTVSMMWSRMLEDDLHLLHRKYR